MKLIDTGYDELLNSNYELYSVKFNDLKTLVKSWYGDINFREFDERQFIESRDERDILECKKSGIVSNLFFAYKNNDKYYLLDGFNRLLTNYVDFNVEQIVYIKILIDDLKDHELIKVMYHLNTWKLSGSPFSDFFDRGMKLLLYKKFNIEFYDYDKQSVREKTGINYGMWNLRERDKCDIEALKYYFRYDSNFGEGVLFVGDFGITLTNTKFIDDLREIIKSNDYLNPPFKNYGLFFYGFIKHISKLRRRGNTDEHKFETYLELLKTNKTFFKKLQGMCGNDSTRINVANFFNNLK